MVGVVGAYHLVKGRHDTKMPSPARYQILTRHALHGRSRVRQVGTGQTVTPAPGGALHFKTAQKTRAASRRAAFKARGHVADNLMHAVLCS